MKSEGRQKPIQIFFEEFPVVLSVSLYINKGDRRVYNQYPLRLFMSISYRLERVSFIYIAFDSRYLALTKEKVFAHLKLEKSALVKGLFDLP